MAGVQFVLGEALIMRQALIQSKRRVTKNRVSIVKQYGQEVYDQMVAGHRSAIGKLDQMLNMSEQVQVATDEVQKEGEN